MSDETQAARDAVAKRVTELAGDADHEQLKALAEAARAVHFAPQDGAYDYTASSEYHDHKHHHNERGRAGFR